MRAADEGAIERYGGGQRAEFGELGARGGGQGAGARVAIE